MKVRKFYRFITKILSGEDVTKVRHDKATWEQQFASGAWDFLLRTPYNIAVISGIIRRAAVERTTPLRVLDVGCGNGALALDLKHEAIEYVGTDISDTALEKARTLNLEGTYQQASMEADPKLEGQFDVIVFSEILLYGDYEKILQVHRKYLKADGLMIISLYDTWRTKIIWWRIDHQFKTREAVYVRNKSKHIGWNIKVCEYHG